MYRNAVNDLERKLLVPPELRSALWVRVFIDISQLGIKVCVGFPMFTLV